MKQHFKLGIILFGALWMTACATKQIPTSPAASPTPAPTTIATIPPTATATSLPTPPSTPLPTSTPTPLPLNLLFSYSVSPSQQTVLERLISKFNRTHPEFRVVGKNQGTIGNPVSAGNRPDVAMSYPSDIAALAKAGWIVPLDDYLHNDRNIFTADDMQDVFPSYVNHYPQFGDKVYSIGFMRSMEVMYYNADLLRAAGFSKPPETWEEFAKACAAVSKPPDIYCYEMKADATDLTTWIYSRGGDMVALDGRAAAFNQKPGLDAMMLLNELFRKKYAIAASRAFQEPGDLAVGKVAFTFDTTLGLEFYARAVKGAGKGIRWGVAPSPRTTAKPIVDLYGPSVAIFKTTIEKERAALIFTQWLADQEPNAEWVQATGYFPARLSTKAQLADFLSANPPYANAFEWLPYGRNEPNVSEWNSVRGFLADAMVAVASGKATPEDALRDAAKKANDVLARQ